MNPFLCLMLLAILLVLPIQFRVWREMQRYWGRACTGALWRRRFPDAPKNAIREFLSVFVEAFAFRKSRRFCFSPNDKVMEIYRAQYPGKGLSDALELETLVRGMQEKYAVDLAIVWNDNITLADLFIHTRSA